MTNFTESFLTTDDSDQTADDLWCNFCVELNMATKKFIPHKLANSRNGLPYLTKDIKRLKKGANYMPAKIQGTKSSNT